MAVGFNARHPKHMDLQNQAMQMMDCSVQGLSIVGGSTSNALNTQGLTAGSTQTYYNGSLWDYWQGPYYGQVIVQSYPAYMQDKAMDKGKQAFEILKSLLDKKLIKLEKVSDFVEAMDTILKTL